MNATINAFPPLHAFNSSRSWFMAAIVLLHAGFFWALSNGLSHQLVKILSPPLVVVTPEATPRVPPKPKPIDDPKDIDHWKIVVPTPTTQIDVPGDNAIVAEVIEKKVDIEPVVESGKSGAGPLVTEDHGEEALGVGAGARELVGVADAGRLDFHQDFTGLRPIKIHRHHFERFAGGISNSGFGFHGVSVEVFAATSMRLPLSSISGMR